MKHYILILLSAGFGGGIDVVAQSPSNNTFNFPETNQVQSVPGNYLKPRSLIVPGTFILYGFAAMCNNPLQKLNNHISCEVKEDMQGFKTRIDDHLKNVPAAMVFALSAVGVKGRHQLFGKTVILMSSTILTNNIVKQLKYHTHRLRPDGSTYNSFPSGHTTTAFLGAQMMKEEYGFRSPWYSVTGYTVAGATALLRITNDRHWLSDVIAAAGIGILSTKVCYWLYSKVEKIRIPGKMIVY